MVTFGLLQFFEAIVYHLVGNIVIWSYNDFRRKMFGLIGQYL